MLSSLMTSQNRLQIRPFVLPPQHTHSQGFWVQNIYLLGVEFDRILRCLSKHADVSLLSSPPPFKSVNISDTGEMGASTPAVTLIFGYKPFHLAPTGSREMYRNTVMLQTVVCSFSKNYIHGATPSKALILKCVCKKYKIRILTPPRSSQIAFKRTSHRKAVVTSSNAHPVIYY